MAGFTLTMNFYTTQSHKVHLMRQKKKWSCNGQEERTRQYLMCFIVCTSGQIWSITQGRITITGFKIYELGTPIFCQDGLKKMHKMIKIQSQKTTQRIRRDLARLELKPSQQQFLIMGLLEYHQRLHRLRMERLKARKKGRNNNRT